MHILFKCVYVCAGVHLCVPHYIGANAGHKLLEPLRLNVRVIVSYLLRVQGTKSMSSIRAVYTLNY